MQRSIVVLEALFRFLLAFVALAVPSLGAAQAPVPSDEVPEGLSSSDWSGIRQAFEADRHAAHPVDGGYLARNPGQRWQTRFDGRGFTTMPDAGGWTWGLQLERYGFAGRERTVAKPARVKAEGPRVERDWDDTLQEWYVNDARGLEHGYTVHRRPPQGEEEGPLTFTLELRGELEPEVQGDGRDVHFLNGDGETVLTYSGLTVFDADGHLLPARLERVAEGLLLTVGEGGARYPLTIDPTAQQAYLKASNTEAMDRFGFSVAVSGDTIVVAATGEDSNFRGVNGDQSDNSCTDSGAVYVFVRNGTTWSQQAYLKAFNTDPDDSFGSSVAISGDTVVVAAIGEASGASGDDQFDNSAPFSGAAYVFARTGTIWSQQAYLKASNAEAFDIFGWSVAVSGDTVVVGAIHENSNASGVNGDQSDNSTLSTGAAYVFVRNGTIWSQQAYLKASNPGSFDLFGNSVAVSGDTVAVGALSEDSNASGVNGDQSEDSIQDSGAAYVFVRNGTIWSQEAYLKASNPGIFDVFGSSVAISGDTVVVGAIREDSGASGVNGDQSDNSAPRSGAAYVFARTGTIWSQQAYLKASNTEEFDTFGEVAVSGDTVVVGAPQEDSASGVNGDQADNSALNAGAAYVFVRTGTSWSQRAYLKASNAGGADNLSDVAISGDTVVAGAYLEDSSATGVDGEQSDNSASASGAAYVFDVPKCVVLDFETEDDFSTPLLNGQHIDVEFGALVSITSSGLNAGAGIFSSAINGPNDPSQDVDLLVDSGNVLILQSENFPPDGNDVFPVPNDDEDGGSLSFGFHFRIEAMSVRLIDVDSSDLEWSVVLTDEFTLQRVYTVPADWTGDLLSAGPGQGTLDLTLLTPQSGFASVATATEDLGFDPGAVVQIDFHLGGSGAIDDLIVCSKGAGVPRASAAMRNGTGVNPPTLSCAALPVLGGTFAANLDCTAMGPGLAILEVCRTPTSGTITLHGEVLVKGELMFRALRAHSGSVSLLTWDVPHDMTLAGLDLYAQGLCRRTAAPLGPRLSQFHRRLSNALDLVLGF